MELIDKSALVREIERRKSELQSKIAELGTFESNTLGLFQEVDLYDDILSFLDTLEVKEVDIEKEALRAVNNLREQPTLSAWFKYFFELGLKAKGE